MFSVTNLFFFAFKNQDCLHSIHATNYCVGFCKLSNQIVKQIKILPGFFPETFLFLFGASVEAVANDDCCLLEEDSLAAWAGEGVLVLLAPSPCQGPGGGNG